ncbi:MAG: phosphatidylserine decarboxylase family protein [Desulfotalea sp.]
MIEPKVPIAKEGIPFIAASAFLTIIAAICEYECLTFILVACTLFIVYFFRDPERFIPTDDNALISPADGKIIVVEKCTDERFLKGEAMKVSIFMNVFNVHVNRIPFSGTVKKIIYNPGKFYSADSTKGAELNENCGVILETKSGKQFAFVQVAGLIARRIVCWLESGDKVTKGNRFGLIRFGSRVDLYLPVDSKVIVGIGEHVSAGETIIATLD